MEIDINAPSSPLQSWSSSLQFNSVPDAVLLSCRRRHTFLWGNISLLSPLKLGCEPPPSLLSQVTVLCWLKSAQVSAAACLSPPLLGHKNSSYLTVWEAKLPKINLILIGLRDLTSRGSEDHEDQHGRADAHRVSVPQCRSSGLVGSHHALQEAPFDPECSSQDKANRHFFPSASPHFCNHK